MEAIGCCPDVVFTAFITLVIYFVLPKLLSHLGCCDSASRDGGLVRKARFLEQIREEVPDEALGVSEFRLMSNCGHREEEVKGTNFIKDDVVFGIRKSGVVVQELAAEEGGVRVGDRSGDDAEAKVVDECSERPKLDEIQEEKRSHVTGTPANSDLGENLIGEGKANATSEARMAVDLSEDVELRHTSNIDAINGNSGSEISKETKLITSENVQSYDHSVEDEELLGGEWEGIERSELEKRFDAAMAVVESKSNADRIDGNLRLQFYGLQRVAMEGPCHEPQPMALKVSARAKWDAWQKLGNMSGEVAMEEYMALLSKSIPQWEDKE